MRFLDLIFSCFFFFFATQAIASDNEDPLTIYGSNERLCQAAEYRLVYDTMLITVFTKDVPLDKSLLNVSAKLSERKNTILTVANRHW